MPIEIRELVIKATVSQESSSRENNSAGGKNTKKEELVKACVEEVLEILKNQKER